jgi:hypothetical protein
VHAISITGIVRQLATAALVVVAQPCCVLLTPADTCVFPCDPPPLKLAPPPRPLQIMVTKEVGEAVGGLKKLVPTGTAVLIEGTLADTPEGTKQVRGLVCRFVSQLCMAVTQVLQTDRSVALQIVCGVLCPSYWLLV